MSLHFKYPEIIIGDSLVALALAYYKGVPVFIKQKPEYYFFDKIGNINKKDLWERYSYLLSMAGLQPFGCNIQAVRHKEEDSIDIITKGGERYTVEYEEKHVIEMPLVTNSRGVTMFEVIDWLDVPSGRVHQYDELSYPERSFVQKILFYETEKYQSATEVYKDLIAFSYLSKNQLKNEDYSEWMTRIEIFEDMKEAGIRGTKNGRNSKGQQLYLKVKLEHDKRVVRNIYDCDEKKILEELKGHRNQHPQIEKLEKVFGEPL